MGEKDGSGCVQLKKREERRPRTKRVKGKIKDRASQKKGSPRKGKSFVSTSREVKEAQQPYRPEYSQRQEKEEGKKTITARLA